MKNQFANQFQIISESFICYLILIVCLIIAYILKEQKYIKTLDAKSKIFYFVSLIFAFILIAIFSKIASDLFLIYF